MKSRGERSILRPPPVARRVSNAEELTVCSLDELRHLAARRDWLTPSFVGASPDGRKRQAHLESEGCRPGQGRPAADDSPRNARKPRKVYRCKLLQQENGRPSGNRQLCWSKDSLAIQAIVSFVCFVVFVVHIANGSIGPRPSCRGVSRNIWPGRPPRWPWRLSMTGGVARIFGGKNIFTRADGEDGR